MQARIKADCKWAVVTAFGGAEFVRYEWRAVPAGSEGEAEGHPYLDALAEIDELPVVPDVPLEELTLEELRLLGKSQGIPSAHSMKRETLIERLK